MHSNKHILSDTHYATTCLNDISTPLDEEIKKYYPLYISKYATKYGAIRGILFWWLGRRYKLLVTAVHHPGWSVLLLLQSLLSNKKNIVLLEFIFGRPTILWKRIIYFLWLKIIIKPSLRRILKSAHVLTAWERMHYSRQFGLPIKRFFFIPYWLRETDDIIPPFMAQERSIVMSSGRVACDWATLFKAAEGTNWQLIIVCRKRDYPILKKLNRNQKAKILCEISPELHDQYLKSADVYVIVLNEIYASVGHVRLRHAIRLGIPIVATGVKGLEGYLFNGQNALLVSPKDHIGLKNAVNKLLSDRDYSQSISRKAFDLAAEYTRNNYRVKVRKFIEQCYEES